VIVDGSLGVSPIRHHLTTKPDFVVWGLGTLGLAVLTAAALRHPNRRFTAITRNPLRPDRLPPNVVLGDTYDLGRHDAPVLICVADDETTALRPYLQNGQLDVGRTVVARRNQRLLDPRVIGNRLRDRTVLVVTNPVEFLCCHLARIGRCRAIYGVGMQIDAARCREVLHAGWGIRLGEGDLPVSGMHGLEPIPVLSAVPGLAERIVEPPWEAVCARLRAAVGTSRLNWVLAPQKLSAVLDRRRPVPDEPYSRVGVAVGALSAAEFDGGHVPVQRAVGHINALVDNWMSGGRVQVSGACRWAASGGAEVFLGGSVDTSGGTFRLPELNLVESDRVTAQVESLRALTEAVGEM
jgi:hypothetical protein